MCGFRPLSGQAGQAWTPWARSNSPAGVLMGRGPQSRDCGAVSRNPGPDGFPPLLGVMFSCRWSVRIQESDRAFPSAPSAAPQVLGSAGLHGGRRVGDPGHLFPGGNFAGHISQHTSSVPTSVSCQARRGWRRPCVSCGEVGWGVRLSALCVCWSPSAPVPWPLSGTQRLDLVPPPHPGTFLLGPGPRFRPQHCLPAWVGSGSRSGREVGRLGAPAVLAVETFGDLRRSGTFPAPAHRAAWPAG